MKDILKPGAKILILLTLFLIGYYFFILGPRLAIPEKAAQLEKEIGQHYFNLLQNRLAFVELTRLNPGSAAFNLEKSSLVETIQKTNQEGQEALKKAGELPKVNQEFSEKFPELIEKTKQVYQKQNQLLERVFKTNSYEAGIEIIKSDESVELLTQETNLILEYQYWLAKIDDLRNKY